MKALIPFACAVALITATQATAQVAVPEPATGTMRLANAAPLTFTSATFTAENPAALQWGGPSQVGAGQFDGESNNSGTQTTDTLEGSFYGARVVLP